MTTQHVCPRSTEDGVVGYDACWREDKTCSYCGSLHPDEFFRRVEAGEEVVPTDKNYKVYVKPGYHKFYFQHLNVEQQLRFIDLLNNKTMKIGYPGHFYVPPFFVCIVKAH